MLSYIKYICFFWGLFLISCEEVVDLDLPEMKPRLVIDASITDGSHCTVIITQSQGFKQDITDIVRIEGAEVFLKDSRGKIDTLHMSKYRGVYESSWSGIAGIEYTLIVIYDGHTYEAKATIPRIVFVDDVYIYNAKIGKTDWYSPCVVFNDPPKIDNYYHSVVYVNGSPLRTLYLHDDEHTDGLTVQRILYYNKEHNGDHDLEEGDQIRVELYSLDKGSYTYFKSINDSSSSNNPTSNFSGNVLGCFKAYNMSQKSITITKDKIYTP